MSIYFSTYVPTPAPNICWSISLAEACPVAVCKSSIKNVLPGVSKNAKLGSIWRQRRQMCRVRGVKPGD